ncbi:MAG: hypothetical protein J6X88_08840 [Bacteroidales bacterium]|nr:hypothetical protein [Bacteroidales bacterium]
MISLRGGHDRYVKKLDRNTHFVAFLFAILMNYDTLCTDTCTTNTATFCRTALSRRGRIGCDRVAIQTS